MPEDAAARKVEVLIGRRVSAAYGGPAFLGEKVRFSGQPLGHYTDTSTVDDDNLLKREDVAYSLYRCPDGYRVVRRETHYRRRGERSRWHMTEVRTSLLPVVEGEDAGRGAPGLRHLLRGRGPSGVPEALLRGRPSERARTGLASPARCPTTCRCGSN